jgi:carboxypeptidase Q
LHESPHCAAFCAELCDRFGHRLLGSAALEESIDYLGARLRADGLDNVHTEEASELPHWTRGQESAHLAAPTLGGGRLAPLRIMALGHSAGTPLDGMEAEVVVARDWRELDALGAQGALNGKMVLLNPTWRGYGDTVAYRVSGASRAAAHGAAAVLIRSMAPFSLANPHTGLGSDTGGVTPIPAASIATEDADMLVRMAARGWDVRVRLTLGAVEHDDPVTSRVVVAELAGSDLAHEVVLLSGHMDSWDVGYGAMDDGAGMAIGWRALALLKRMGLRPRRTLRFVAWVGEEWGVGGAQYWREHAAEAGNITLAAESDSGVFAPAALQLAAPVEAHALARAIVRIMDDAGAPIGVTPGGEGADISPAMALGIPGLSLHTRAATWFRYSAEWNASGPAGPHFQGDYFAYHHSGADTPSLLDGGQMDASLAAWASFAFVVANVTTPMPRGVPAGAAQLATELGEGPWVLPPPVCGPGWEAPAPRKGGDDAGSGLSAAQIALLAFSSAMAGAGAVWLMLVPFGSRAEQAHSHTWTTAPVAPAAGRGSQAGRPVPVVPYRRLPSQEEGSAAEQGGAAAVPSQAGSA